MGGSGWAQAGTPGRGRPLSTRALSMRTREVSLPASVAFDTGNTTSKRLLQLQQHVFGAAHAAVEQLAHECGAHCEQQAQKQGDSRVQQHPGRGRRGRRRGALDDRHVGLRVLAFHAALVDALGHGVVGALGVLHVALQHGGFVAQGLELHYLRTLRGKRCAHLRHAALGDAVVHVHAAAGAGGGGVQPGAQLGEPGAGFHYLRVVVAQAGGQLLHAAFFACHVGAQAGHHGVVQHLLHLLGPCAGLGLAAAGLSGQRLQHHELGGEF